MSHQHAFQLFDRNVFASGPYLRAFDALPDIDAHEHSLLTYLGSLLPSDKGVINEPVSPSIPEIFRATKMSVSTVRRRLRSLENKGYLVVRSVHYLNPRGKSQQGANEYCLTTKAFDAYLAHIPFAEEIQDDPILPARREKQNFPSSAPSLKAGAQSAPEEDQKALKVVAIDTNPEQLPDQIQQSSNATDRIIHFWTHTLGLRVGQQEVESFCRGFKTLGRSDEYYYARIREIACDPKLKRTAKNINFLLLPMIEEKIHSDDPHQMKGKAMNSEEPTPNKEDERAQEPADQNEILSAIDRCLLLEIAPDLQARLAILREAVPRCQFEVSLKLFKKHVQPILI